MEALPPTGLIPWQRFWVPRGRSLDLDYGAFLPDPESPAGRQRNPTAVTALFFEDRPCVVLLGETAMGKSKAVMEVDSVEADIRRTASGIVTVRRSLGDYTSDAFLVEDIFHSTELRSLTERNTPLHLYLDSFDEGLLRIETLPRLVVLQLERLSRSAVQQLRLRTLCRSSVWPQGLEHDLARIWGLDQVDAYELAPLRIVDVCLAAQARNVDADAFLATVDARRLWAFAARPLTLLTLLSRFSQGHDLPEGQGAIYEAGCLELCAASARPERGVQRPHHLTPDERLAIAGRIAAAAMFSGREFIQREWTDPGDDATFVAQRDLAGTDQCDGQAIGVGASELKEVAATALFAATHGNTPLLRWAHRSYAEFLAARYLVDRDADIVQILSLVVHPEDPDGGLIAPLHETTAWLASFREDVFAEVAVRAPFVLLTSDAVGIDPAFRARIVEALLSQYNAGNLLPPDWATRERFTSLDHPGLTEQLARWLGDRSKSRLARRVAINIAEACRTTGIVDTARRVALDPDDDLRTRTLAAHTVGLLGDSEARKALLPLIAGAADDPDAQLKGCALQATWPDILTAERLFQVLTPSRSGFHGFYRSFLFSEPMRHLREDDIPLALAWVDRQLHSEAYDVRLQVDAIMIRAVEALDIAEVAEAFAAAAWRRLSIHGHVFRESPYADFGGSKEPPPLDETQRRSVLGAMLAHHEGFGDWLDELVLAGIAVPADVPMLLASLPTAAAKGERLARAQLLALILRYEDRENVEATLEARENDPALREATVGLFDAIAIESDAATRRRHVLQRMREREAGHQVREQRAAAAYGERLVAELDACERGDVDAWWRLNYVLLLDPENHHGNEYEPDITVLPGWRDAADRVRSRIVDAGVVYLGTRIPEPTAWLGTDSIHRPDWAGYRAMHLLWRLDDPRLSAFDTAVWARWAPVLVGFPANLGAGDISPQQALVGAAFRHAPREVVNTLEGLIPVLREPYYEAGTVLQRVAECWSESLAESLRRLLANTDLPPRTSGALLRVLLGQRDLVARDTATRWLTAPLQIEPNGARAIEAATALAELADDAGWEAVWPAIVANPSFGEEVVSRLAWMDDFANGLSRRLTERQLGDLYRWLEHRYPEAEDPDEPDVHAVTRREQLGRWRDGVLRNLVQRGSADAVAAVRAAKEEFPALEKLWLALLQAQTAARPRAWLPPHPRHVLALAAASELRLVRNADQLRELVVESLARLGARLQQQESRAVTDLWNVIGPSMIRGVTKTVLANLRTEFGRGRPELTVEGYWDRFSNSVELATSPKEEILLSDYIKRHLDDDLGGRGVIVNREVENRPRSITDIRVDATVRGELAEHADTVSVIVEVKGCWNPGLDTAMQTQLTERYLQPAGLSHGVYLVLWFGGTGWDSSDRRLARCRRSTAEEARTRLAEQAATMARKGLSVTAVVLDASLPDDILVREHDDG